MWGDAIIAATTAAKERAKICNKNVEDFGKIEEIDVKNHIELIKRLDIEFEELEKINMLQ